MSLRFKARTQQNGSNPAVAEREAKECTSWCPCTMHRTALNVSRNSADGFLSLCSAGDCAERFRGEGFGPGGPGHAAGLVWPAVAPPPSRATATAAAAAAAAAAEARCLPDLVALLAAQPCEAVAIDALQLLVDIARARGAHGQPPLLQLQQPLVELQGKLRAALGAASARAGARPHRARTVESSCAERRIIAWRCPPVD